MINNYRTFSDLEKEKYIFFLKKEKIYIYYLRVFSYYIDSQPAYRVPY